MVLGYTQLASIPITLSRMRLDSKLFSSEASQLGLPWVGSLLTHPSALNPLYPNDNYSCRGQLRANIACHRKSDEA